jgi:hypothetical protein
MMFHTFSLRLCLMFLFLALPLCFAPDTTAAAVQPSGAPARKAAPVARKTVAPKKKETVEERMQRQLVEFMQKTITSMNRQRKPGINAKEVTRTSNGMYKARYLFVEPESLVASHKATGKKAVPYVGQVVYYEIEYVSIGATERQAQAGPFRESDRMPITEIIKYMRGKWTY